MWSKLWLCCLALGLTLATVRADEVITLIPEGEWVSDVYTSSDVCPADPFMVVSADPGFPIFATEDELEPTTEGLEPVIHAEEEPEDSSTYSDDTIEY